MSLLAFGFSQRATFFYILSIVLGLLALATLLTPPSTIHSQFCSFSLPNRFRPESCDAGTPLTAHYDRTLGVASSIHVVSLERRRDRRQRMELIRKALRLQWEYSYALDKDDMVVDRILHAIHDSRKQRHRTAFAWPNIQTAKTLVSQSAFSTDLIFPIRPKYKHYNLVSRPIFCATEDNKIPTYENISNIPLHLSLSRGMVACWYSHLHLIFEVAQRTINVEIGSRPWDGKEGVAIIFEDDIDMEWDLRERLEKMWVDLPRDWDIVFLGHCWSNEAFYPPLTPSSPLHPSHEPKCTHGYAISPKGARKLAVYLTYPPFAFSRAIDQAIAHLVSSKRLRAFSIVPSVVAQRRCGDRGQEEVDCKEDSDIRLKAGMTGAWWKDELEDSVIEKLMKGDDQY